MSFRNLDFFRKLPNDIETSTISGGIFTILAFAIGAYLFFQEYHLFVSKNMIRQMKIDQQSHSNELRINIDATFHNIPCLALSVCQEDELGHHTVDIGVTLIKYRLDQQGNIITQRQDRTVEALQLALDQQEQCQIKGYLQVTQVPGDFHVSYHANKDLVMRLGSDYFQKVKMDYTLNDFRFGEASYDDPIYKEFQALGTNVDWAPYNGMKSENEVMSNFNNYIKIVPNKYISENKGGELNAYQFSMNSRDKPTVFGEMTSVYFNYEISPITIEYSIKTNSLFHFIVEMLAIIGGIFSVLGIFSALTMNSLEMIKKKN